MSDIRWAAPSWEPDRNAYLIFGQKRINGEWRFSVEWAPGKTRKATHEARETIRKRLARAR